MSEILELKKFNEICNDLNNGKYILVENKISSLLNAINEDEKIKDIVASCLNNYDFVSGFENSENRINNKLILSPPNEEKELIAYVFTLLYKFKNKDINLYSFLVKYFGGEDVTSGQEFASFCKILVLPFKDAINAIYSKRHVIIGSEDYQNNIYNKLKLAIELIYKNIDNYKLKLSEKEEFSMLLNSLYTASEQSNKKLVFSLMIGLDYFTKANKKARAAYLSLEECFSNN